MGPTLYALHTLPLLYRLSNDTVINALYNQRQRIFHLNYKPWMLLLQQEKCAHQNVRQTWIGLMLWWLIHAVKRRVDVMTLHIRWVDYLFRWLHSCPSSVPLFIIFCVFRVGMLRITWVGTTRTTTPRQSLPRDHRLRPRPRPLTRTTQTYTLLCR
jgi:hypothetical protein